METSNKALKFHKTLVDVCDSLSTLAERMKQISWEFEQEHLNKK